MTKILKILTKTTLPEALKPYWVYKDFNFLLKKEGREKLVTRNIYGSTAERAVMEQDLADGWIIEKAEHEPDRIGALIKEVKGRRRG